MTFETLGNQPYPKDHDAFYSDLTSRNRHFISAETQAKLRKFRILIAGCGSTGGACIEALARVGIEYFILADNGTYELSNLNRQHARLKSIGKNKAAFHKEEVQQINPFAHCEIETDGIQKENVEALCRKVDLVFDAVDVTTPEGIASKIALHVEAHRQRLPVFSALDLGLRQWGKSFDYRTGKLPVLDGKLDAALRAQNPIKALFTIYPTSSIPNHCLQLVLDLLNGDTAFASQLGCTSDMLSGIIVPAVLRLLETGDVVPGWDIDLSSIRYSNGADSSLSSTQAPQLRTKLHQLLEELH